MESSQCHATFPGRPQGMTVADYDAHVQRGHCAKLLDGTCDRPCEPVSEDGTYPVDFDHIFPRSKGGDNSGWNFQPLCQGQNRWIKSANLDPEFEAVNHFDQQVNSMMLRPNQSSHGYDMVKGVYADLFKQPSRSLQQCFILLAWMVGTGKSIGMTAILHAINEVINHQGPGRPRIRKVLWLVHQETLVKSICEEVKTEPTKYCILQQEPKTHIIQKAEDWNTAIAQADMVFACTQSLWKREGSALSDIDRAHYLGHFDAIVIDECHFAVERYAEILRAAPRALKFVMSATPHDANGVFLSEADDGRYRHLFRLFSVFGYRSAYEHELIKKVPEWEDGLKTNHYIAVKGGTSTLIRSGESVQGETNTSNRHNSPRTAAIIKTAIDVAAAIKEYPAHVMVRCEAVAKLKALQKTIEGEPHEYFPSDSPGWGVTSIYSGAKGVQINDNNHPWMIIKKDSKKHGKPGTLKPDSKRLLLAVNMGQFGLNNPYCAVVAWVYPNMSLVEIVQRIGRAVRLVKGVDHAKQSIYLVFADDPDLKSQIQKAVDYIISMEDNVIKAFPALDEPMGDIVTPMPPLAKDVSIDQRLRFEIQEAQGHLLPEGLSPDDIRDIIESVNIDDEQKDVLFEKISTYVENLLDETYKDKQFGLPKSAEPLEFVAHEECKDAFSPAEMEAYVRSHYKDVDIPSILEDIDAGRTSVIQMLTAELKRKHTNFHRPPGEFFSVQSILGIDKDSRDSDFGHKDFTYYGRLKTNFNELIHNSNESESRKICGILSKCLYSACSQVFGLENFQKTTYAKFEAQLSSTLCSPLVAHRILSRAKALAIYQLQQQMSGHYKLYCQQITQFLMGEKDNA